jgi:hypothetical protein
MFEYLCRWPSCACRDGRCARSTPGGPLGYAQLKAEAAAKDAVIADLTLKVAKVERLEETNMMLREALREATATIRELKRPHRPTAIGESDG